MELYTGVAQDIENWGWGKNSRAPPEKNFAAAPTNPVCPPLVGAHDLFAPPLVETEQYDLLIN